MEYLGSKETGLRTNEEILRKFSALILLKRDWSDTLHKLMLAGPLNTYLVYTN